MTFREVRLIHGVKSWRRIRGVTGNYRITSCGRVWSCRWRKFIRQDYNLDSYLRVELRVKGTGRKWFFVHRLVADHYKKNPNPKTHTHINHIDHNRHNNNCDNLEHLTPSDNIAHAKRKHLTRYVYRGRGKWRELTYEQQKEKHGCPF